MLMGALWAFPGRFLGASWVLTGSVAVDIVFTTFSFGFSMISKLRVLFFLRFDAGSALTQVRLQSETR